MFPRKRQDNRRFLGAGAFYPIRRYAKNIFQKFLQNLLTNATFCDIMLSVAGDMRWCSTMAVQLICNQQVVGSNPITSSNIYGGIPEWPKGTDCKSAGYAFGGSNPPSPTRKKLVRKNGLFSRMFAFGK